MKLILPILKFVWLLPACLLLQGAWILPLPAQTQTNALDDPKAPSLPDSQTEPDRDSTSPSSTDITPTKPEDDRTGKILLQETKNSLSADTRPDLPERPGLEPEIARKIEDFNKFRERYERERTAIIRSLKGATEADREKIRQRLKELRERWRKSSEEIREETIHRQEDLKRKLFEHRRLLDEARDKVNQVRDRPAIDK